MDAYSVLWLFTPWYINTRHSVPRLLAKYLLHRTSFIQKYFRYKEPPVHRVPKYYREQCHKIELRFELKIPIFLPYLQTIIKKPTYMLTHWGRVTHICVGKLTIIGSDNGLSPGRRQAIIWTSAGILLIGPLETNFSEILIEMYTFSFKKMHLKMSSAKWRPFCLGLDVLRWKYSYRWFASDVKQRSSLVYVLWIRFPI